MTYKTPSFQGKLKCFLICVIAFLPGIFPRMKRGDLTPKLADCYRRFSNVTLDRVVGKFLSWHCETPLSLMQNHFKLSSSQLNYVNGLTRRMGGVESGRNKRQAQRCIRKEYRMLTKREREDYHRAVNGLKQNRIVEPNVYDALAMLHSEMVIFKAHGGPCFLGWHRVYLLMYEMALNDEVPGVCLPYWDSSLDNELDDPAESYMFSPEFIGNGDGPVITGPFAGWRRPSDRASPNSRQTPLIRNVGVDGQLYTRQSIEMILSRNDHAEIIAPNADPDYDIEVQHGGIHMFIGGEMEALETSPFDPIFFMHHAFVDYIWELFRMKLRNQNIDPATNYPMNHNIQFHGRDELMDFSNFTCGQGYSDRLMDTVEYETSPSCTQRNPTCNSPYLRCEVDIGRCIPINPGDFVDEVDPSPIGPVPFVPGSNRPGPTGPIRQGPFVPGSNRQGPAGTRPFRPSPISQGPAGTRPAGPSPIRQGPIGSPAASCAHIQRERHHVKPCQNTYCLNGVCDINQWVYVPVKVVTMRPPGFGKYGSYPVVNGDISSKSDIYQPNAYDKTRRLIKTTWGKTPKGYSHCEDQSIGQIFVTSQGLNYEGVYKESALIDQRLATTMSIAYLAVKNPGLRGITRALFRAADSCGRVCHTSCKNHNTGLYEPCSGVIELDSKPPRMYSMNYGDATMDVWDYGRVSRTGTRVCPTFKADKFFLTFYCTYNDHLPWVDRMTAPAFSPMAPVFARRRMPAPIVSRQGCRVSSSCVLDVSCHSTSMMCRTFGETHQCRGSCGRYAVCVYGHYHERFCSSGMSFSEKMHRCTSTRCSRTHVHTHRSRSMPRSRPITRSPWNTFKSSSGNYMRSLSNRMRSGIGFRG